MIIAFAGKKNSGKDLAADISQYLINRYDFNQTHLISQEDFLNWYPLPKQDRNWKVIKFADKIKDIVCLLTGCTKADLEDQDFKSSEVSEEWWFFGGTSVGDPSIYSKTKIPYIENENNPYWNRLYKPTYRDFLQYIGTELFRNMLHENTWINAVLADYKPKYFKTVKNVEKPFLEQHITYPNWFITDLRFQNEYEALKRKDAITVKLIRKKTPMEWEEDISNFVKVSGIVTPLEFTNLTYQEFYDYYCFYFEILDEQKYNEFELIRKHASETELETFDCKYTITNDDTIDKLIKEIEYILLQEQIITKPQI